MSELAMRPASRRVMAALWLALVAAPACAGTRPVTGLPAPVMDGTAALPGAPEGLARYRFAGSRDWPALRFHASAPLDWSRAGALAVPVDNPGDAPFTLLLRLDDSAAADGDDRSLTGLVVIPAHAHGAAVLPLEAGPGGMRGRPIAAIASAPGDLLVTDLRGGIDTRHVLALHISGVRTDQDRVLAIGAPVLRDPAAGRPAGAAIADGYGQAIAGSWPEKVASEADLGAELATAALATRRLAALNPAKPARGPFRVAKANGRWRLLDAAGKPFFSLGVDAVVPSNPTIVAARRALFADLPTPGSPLARFLTPSPDHGELFDVGAANLARAYGEDWRRRWMETTRARLSAWGFNTLGNWSDRGLAADGFASVDFTDFEGDSALVPMDDGRVLPDPFDPRFAALADGVARQMTAANRNAPALLGYFSGNEMPWGSAARPEAGVAAHVLRLGADSPAKRVLLDQLRQRYGSPQAFAGAWSLPAAADWSALLDRAVPLAGAPTAAARADMARFQGAFADRYFDTVAQAIHSHDPSHLYLGTRFADAPPEVVAACAHWCDVMSFNVYGATPEGAAARWRGFDRPVLIGEFHFGSTDRGSFWPGMVDAGSESSRGPAYAAYLAGALRDPAIVGVHWYQYADEPLTGRPYDGENGHIGLVAVTDVPYAGFVQAVARANRRALDTFAAAARTVP